MTHLYEPTERFRYRGIALTLLTLSLLVALFIGVMGTVRARTDLQQKQQLRQAARRAAVTCFAIEGRYPPTREYLSEHYGVMLETEKYFVEYRCEGGNLFPDIRVLTKGVAQ